MLLQAGQVAQVSGHGTRHSETREWLRHRCPWGYIQSTIYCNVHGSPEAGVCIHASWPQSCNLDEHHGSA